MPYIMFRIDATSETEETQKLDIEYPLGFNAEKEVFIVDAWQWAVKGFTYVDVEFYAADNVGSLMTDGDFVFMSSSNANSSVEMRIEVPLRKPVMSQGFVFAQSTTVGAGQAVLWLKGRVKASEQYAALVTFDFPIYEDSI